MNFIKFVRIFLLILIVTGVGLLVTQKIWVPKLVDRIVMSENNNITTINASTSTKQENTKKTYCTDEEFSKNITQGLPNDVKPMVDRIIICNYLGGEVGDQSPERTDDLNRSMEDYKCATYEKDQQDLMDKYIGDERVANAIKSANSWDWISCN